MKTNFIKVNRINQEPCYLNVNNIIGLFSKGEGGPNPFIGYRIQLTNNGYVDVAEKEYRRLIKLLVNKETILEGN